jgi:hypothetical protein
MLNTGSVTNVFARISLDQPPGYVCFKYLNLFESICNIIPISQLTELDFSEYAVNSHIIWISRSKIGVFLFRNNWGDGCYEGVHFNVLFPTRGITDTS